MLQLNYAQWHALTAYTAAERVPWPWPPPAPTPLAAPSSQHLLALRRCRPPANWKRYLAPAPAACRHPTPRCVRRS